MSRWTDVGLALESDPRIRSLNRWRVVDEVTGEAITGYLRVDEACIYADRMAEEMREAEMLRAIARECRCCPDCWDVPCGACQAGGVCDDICNCHDPEHDGSADELDEEDAS